MEKWKDYDEMMKENPELAETLNRSSKERLLDKRNIDGIAKALSRYVYKNNAAADLVIKAVKEGRWLQLELLYGYYSGFEDDQKEGGCAEADLEQLLKELLRSFVY
ncbi:hypothetical protein [uncultured Robinsoniella sp.]|uniref:hypothetical protein n=1 Tax=uncultured Robinsoniella sp. TaxID=904190 RepID=UPI00374FA079